MSEAIRSSRFSVLWRVGVILLAVAVWVGIAWSLLPRQHTTAAAKANTAIYTPNDESERLARLAALEKSTQTPGVVPVKATSAPLGPTTSAPGELMVPSVGIDGPVFPVGIDRSGNMDVTKSAFTAGWYNRGPAPGQPGIAIFACHNTWYTAPRALCFNLHLVQPGAVIATKDARGNVHHWVVDSLKYYPYSAIVDGLFVSGGPARISIITCAGTWLPKQQVYTQRLIVGAHLADA